MPRNANKSDQKTITVNIEEFTKTRDSVLASLAQLQTAAFELSRAYITHSNTVLGLENTNVDIAAVTSTIAASLEKNALPGAHASTPAPEVADAGGKKKRKRVADPNAPKRTLTPFFLYMHHNRQHIAADLGSDAKPKDVSSEGTRRWAEMPDNQKEVWKKLYADNLATYREKVAAYKAGLPFEKDDNDKAADQLHLDVAAVEASDEEDDEEEEQPEDEEEEEAEEESSPEPLKEPTPPPSKRRRSEGKPSKDLSSPVLEKKGKNESPEKKKRGGKKEETARKSPENKRTKKKRKSNAGVNDDE
ncbi:hypothetical protein BJY04DRAFT_182778 [Aspergillus karnatakaensis]|uniref:uncharacterized protein n=1 Tax=Aspergillus karnatakaensis TaxID=1810916 RepID=UPI003CCDBD86